MKTKIYLLITFLFLVLAVSAQKFNVMYDGYWTNNTWVDTLKTTAAYDANGHVTTLTSQRWNSQTNTWDNAAIIAYALNGDGTIREMLIQGWLADNNTWMDFSKTTFTYSASKKILSQTTQIGGIDFVKISYTYDTNDLLTNELVQTVFLVPTNSEQTNYTYNADGTENTNVVQSWNNQWVNSVRSTNTYNPPKKLASTLKEMWQNEAWGNASKTTLTYNANDSIAESLEQIWANEAWVNSLKDSYSYNANGNLVQVISQEWNSSGQWENTARITYDYSTGTNHELAAMAFLAFPNPFIDQLTIEGRS
ncbi:MAG TPA: hypothetical protein VGK10_16880, partial [Prolixibacteraceae bacterium]